MTEDVSRETPPPPSLVEGVFSSGAAGAHAFHDLLAGDGILRGVIGPREVERLWERHLLNCAVVAEAAPHAAEVADIGSGAGLPGLTWALARPDLAVTLVEPLGRRVDFLQEAIETLGLSNVTVLRARAEELHGSVGFDVVTSRAVAPLDKLARWSLPLVRPGGLMVALKGRSAEDEIARSGRVIHKLGGRSIAVAEYGADWLATPTRAIRVQMRGGSAGAEVPS